MIISLLANNLLTRNRGHHTGKQTMKRILVACCYSHLCSQESQRHYLAISSSSNCWSFNRITGNVNALSVAATAVLWVELAIHDCGLDTWSWRLSSFRHETFGIFNIPSRSWFKRISRPSAVQTSPFTFMAISKEYLTHLFRLIVCKVTLLLQVDTSVTCAIPYWKCTGLLFATDSWHVSTPMNWDSCLSAFWLGEIVTVIAMGQCLYSPFLAPVPN